MATTFKTKSSLPIATQQEIERILAIDSGQRTSSEADFLTSLAPYLTNEIILAKADGSIVIAEGSEVPSGAEGFIKGAEFIKTDVTGLVITFKNIGDKTSAVWLASIEGEGVPVDYTDGDPVATGQDYAIVGSRYTDILTGTIYINTGTSAEPVWEALAFVA